MVSAQDPTAIATPGWQTYTVRAGPCARWSEVTALLQSVREIPDLRLLDVDGLREGTLALTLAYPTTLPFDRVLAAALPPDLDLELSQLIDMGDVQVPGAVVHLRTGGFRRTTGRLNAGVRASIVQSSRGLEAPAPTIAAAPAAAIGSLQTPAELQSRPAAQETTAAGAAGSLVPGAARSGAGEAARPEQPHLRVLIALDGSRGAERALSFVASHLGSDWTDVHLMSVLDEEEGEAIEHSIERSSVASYRRLYLRACAQDLRDFRVRCIIAAHDSPAEALLIYAAENAVDVLVLTTGSVPQPASSEQRSLAALAIQSQRVPVLVIPPRGGQLVPPTA